MLMEGQVRSGFMCAEPPPGHDSNIDTVFADDAESLIGAISHPAPPRVKLPLDVALF